MLRVFEQILKAAPDQTATVWPLTSHFLHHPRKDILDATGKAGTIS